MKSTASKPETDWAQEEAERLWIEASKHTTCAGLYLTKDGANLRCYARTHGGDNIPIISRLETICALRAAEERGHARGIEEACKAVCKLCAEGKLEAGRCRGHWHHYWSTEGDEGGEIAGDCEAWKIRNLLPERKEQDEPTVEYVRGYLAAANEIAEPYPPDIPMFAPLSDEEIRTAVAAMGGDISGRLHAHWARHWADVLRKRIEERQDA